ncbi:MAG TPA: hypothetical protein VK211_28770 [Kamptonema sp.]|nr:hypothetical protein [Kamptonema sp.]
MMIGVLAPTRVGRQKISRTFFRVRLWIEIFVINLMITDFKLDRIFCEIQQNLNDLTLQQVATIQGTLNALVYSAAANDGLVWRSPDRALHFNFENIGYFFRTDRAIITPVTFIADYLKKFWAGLAHYSRDAVQRIRWLISDRFKVFTQEDRTADWRNPKNRHRNPNPAGEFNMLRALLLARACEEHLLCYGRQLEATQLNLETVGNGCYEWERIEEKSFPQHKGFLMAAIGHAAGIWTGDGEPHPEIVGVIELEYLRVAAENQYEQTEPGDRTEAEILEKDWLAVTESETVVSDGVAVVVEKVVDAIPLVMLVRRSMRVPARRLLPRAEDGGVSVPSWVRIAGDRARAWWERQIFEHRWLQDVAPDWVLEAAVGDGVNGVEKIRHLFD